MRYLACTPITHAAGLIVLTALLRGGTVVLHSGFDPTAVLGLIAQHRITMTFLVPTMIYRLLDDPALDTTDVNCLEVIVYGAAPMSLDRLRQGLQRLGPVFMQLYAQTEAPNTVTVLSRHDHDLSRPDLLTSCGRSLPGLQVEIHNDDGVPVPNGEIGGVCVRGPLIMDGYWNRPEGTSHALRDGWLHTGDIGRQDADGYIYLLDRRSDVIITGGFNVYPREVEDALCAHPAVSAAAVIGVPHPDWGVAVTAFVVRHAGVDVTSERLAAHVRTQKGAVHTPKVIEFVTQLPLTPLGNQTGNRCASLIGTGTAGR